VLAESGVERTTRPPAGSYLGELLRAFQEWLVGWIERGVGAADLPEGVVRWIVAGLLAIALAVVARSLLARRRVARRGTSEGVPTSIAGAPAGAEPWDAARWRAELDRRLAGGDAAGALEAAWWWMARTLAGSRVEADWTSRDLLARARREDLRPLARRIEALSYGRRRPAPEDLRELVARLEEALA
jgi:hypothetical protein